MEAEDDMIVLVVVDDEEKSKSFHPDIKQEPGSSSEDILEVNDIIETAEKHGQYIAVKMEPEDLECDYLEDEVLQRVLKSEPSYDEQYDNDDHRQDYVPDEDDNEQYIADSVLDNQWAPKKHRFTMLKPWQQKSFVAELRQEYPELKEDEELLIKTLEQIMRSVKPPPPPQDYYVVNGVMFECIQCGSLADTLPAITRHYQEKHGQRYLVCYACGVDFRSTTNLYKHEKRCVSRDAHVVLKARAACVGRKGRSRPYLPPQHAHCNQRARFPCQLCSAVFMTRNTLQSHENLHRGERPFRCHVCPCAYTSYSALSRHTKKHTDVQYICDHCSRSFKVKAALVSHLDTHKPVRKHGCAECSRRFAQKSALRLHVDRVHRHLPPPCACQICPKRYPRMSLLKAHMKRAHGMSIITRKMFFKSLPTMTELEVKESKVILKSDDDILDYGAPYKTEEMFEQSIQQNLQDETHEEENADYVQSEFSNGHVMLDNFMQYVTKGTKDLGSNVIYIQNGEMVHIGEGPDNLVLQVGAVVEGSEVLLDTLNNGDRIQYINSAVKTEDLNT